MFSYGKLKSVIFRLLLKNYWSINGNRKYSEFSKNELEIIIFLQPII